MGTLENIYFGRHFACLKYFTYHLVPVLAPNYKQNILSPAKDGKFMLFISWTLCQICLFDFSRVEGDATFIKHVKVRRKL
jgi:hypothetical protein